MNEGDGFVNWEAEDERQARELRLLRAVADAARALSEKAWHLPSYAEKATLANALNALDKEVNNHDE